MRSPVGKVIGSFLVAGASYASHLYLHTAVDSVVQFFLLQLALHYGVTFGCAPTEPHKA